MINTKTNTDVLEKNQSAGYTEQAKSTSNSASYSQSNTISNDLIKNYTDKGLFIEQQINADSANDATVNSNAAVDSNPSETTLQFSFDSEDFDDYEQEFQERTYKISAKGKVMIVLYSLVVATIIALIAVNASVLRSMQQKIDNKESSINSLVMQTETLKEELSVVSSEETITSKAIEMGLTK